jgi:steroid delta-isomerase-like uncharacterized protein
LTEPLTIHASEALARAVFAEVFNGHDLDRIDDYFGADYAHDAPIPPGRDSFKAFMAAVVGAFPDFNGTLEDVIVGGDKVVCRSIWRGTHEAELMGIPATGRSVEYRVIEIFRVENGRFVEHWQQSDTLTMFQQLGLLPEVGSGG